MITVSAVAAASSSRSVYSPSPYSFSSPARPGASNSLHPLRFAPPNFSSWSGLKHMGFSQAARKELERRKNRQRSMVAYASLFGVGAPEALVIGVVALLVFGPKGLAEVARNLGKTLRAFQPTIRELQDVSREFKSTLEREIGLDDLPEQNMYNPNRTRPSPPRSTIAPDEGPQSVPDPNTTQPSGQAYSSEEYLKITEEQLKLAQQKKEDSETLLSGEDLHESKYKPPVEETTEMPPPPPKSENGT